MTNSRKSLYLLADSQLLFWECENSRLISSIRENLDSNKATMTKAAYIGASNGDDIEYFNLFVAAMDNIDLHESRMILSDFSSEDQEFIKSADLILLAGGDMKRGWESIKRVGMDEIIRDKYYSGTVIIGVSAGAIQIGMGGRDSGSESCFVETLQLAPYYFGVHEEDENWSLLKHTVQEKDQYSKGFGIPAGGGIIYHPDSTVEPLRSSVNEFRKSGNQDSSILSSILLPPDFGD